MEILHSIYILNSKYSSYRVLIFFSVPLEHVIHTHTPSVCSVEILGKCFVLFPFLFYVYNFMYIVVIVLGHALWKFYTRYTY